MRLLADLSARANTEYDTAYHHKLRGRIWRALRGTEYDDEHGSDSASSFTYSNIFPWGRIEEGDNRHFLIASPDEELLTHVARDLQDDRELNVGEMPFRVEDLSVVEPDVGEPGTTGTITTATGVVVRLYEDHREEYDIVDEDADDGSPTYWRQEHSLEPFIDAIEDNLQWKHDQFAPDYALGPADVDGRLFEGYEFLKTYAIPVTVSTGTEIDIVLSKWRFDYRVRDDDHRRHLNLALDTGIGGRNGLGFGFVNIVEKQPPGAERQTLGEGSS